MRVSQQFHLWHRTIGDLRFVPPNLYIRKQVSRFWQSWRQLSKQARQRFRGPRPVLPSLLRPICQACDSISKVKAIFSSRTFGFEYYFFCGLLSLKHNTFVPCYKGTDFIDTMIKWVYFSVHVCVSLCVCACMCVCLCVWNVPIKYKKKLLHNQLSFFCCRILFFRFQ